MDFAYGESFTESSPEAYERLILDVLIGEAPLFPRHAEVEASWRILDPVRSSGPPTTSPTSTRPGLGAPARPTRCSPATAVPGGGRDSLDLTDTSAGAIDEALVQARRRMGGPASGMVMTLVIVTDECEQYDALRSASQAAREHPSRVLAVIIRKPKGPSRLDAEMRFLGDSGPGETVVLRMHGELGQHAESVLVPLLAPDVPVVIWWPRALPAPRHGPGRRARPAPGDRRGGQRDTQGHAADAGQGLPAG